MRISDWSSDVCSSDLGGDSFDDLEQQAKAVLGAAHVAIGAELGAVAQELVDQIAVRDVELDTGEPGGTRVSRRPRVLVQQAGGLGHVERARGGMGESVSVRVDLGGRRSSNKKKR